MIYLFDTTLRDGSQGEDISFSVEDKLNISNVLDRFGIDYIEAGWPGSNPKDIEFFSKSQSTKIQKYQNYCFWLYQKSAYSMRYGPQPASYFRSKT